MIPDHGGLLSQAGGRVAPARNRRGLERAPFFTIVKASRSAKTIMRDSPQPTAATVLALAQSFELCPSFLQLQQCRSANSRSSFQHFSSLHVSSQLAHLRDDPAPSEAPRGSLLTRNAGLPLSGLPRCQCASNSAQKSPNISSVSPTPSLNFQKSSAASTAFTDLGRPRFNKICTV